ncbi:hypothetical protein C0J52_21084 [Blattella germanica]|nr:hypothetical protein C0J52_21084 [Blattella germanica]
MKHIFIYQDLLTLERWHGGFTDPNDLMLHKTNYKYLLLLSKIGLSLYTFQIMLLLKNYLQLPCFTTQKTLNLITLHTDLF